MPEGDRMVDEGFLHPDQRRDLWHGDDIEAMLAWMHAYEPLSADKGAELGRRSLR